ncbi:MAG: response regulator transcription factor, partial [Anaerolineales bacterium]
MPPLRLLLADDHRLFCQGLRRVCEAAGLTVVAEAENGQEAVHLARQTCPDVVLMDIQMPVLDGVEATRQIVEACPKARVLVLTMFSEDRYVFEALKAGAQGYLLKDIDERDLVEAVRRVGRGEALLDPGLAARLLDEFRRLSRAAEKAEGLEDLTEGEMQVLRLVAQGADNKTVARTLHLSERTVANRLSEIYRKLHVNSRTQAA